MQLSVVIVLVGVVIALVVLAVAAQRLGRLRGVGTAVVLRDLPADGDRGWRHGVIRYGDDAVEYFRLRSLRPGPARVLSRQSLETMGRRRPHGNERDLLDGDLVVLELSDGATRFELALDSGAVTAFQSWLESRPSVRMQRRRN